MNRESQLEKIRVSVPGKIMIAGEYSILNGGRSLSAAVDSHLHLTVRSSTGFQIHSDLWSDTLDLWQTKRGEPLIDSLRFCAARYEIRDAKVEVKSELQVSLGLGSSSAVRLAAHIGLLAFAHQDIALSSQMQWQAARDAWLLQRAQQGFASGYDLLTQLHGGFILWHATYENWPGPIQNLNLDWLHQWVHPYGGGVGAPTTTVGGSVRKWLDKTQAWTDLQRRSEDLIDAFLSERPEQFMPAIETHQQLLRQAPFYPASLYKSLASLSGFGRSWTFKTTGAGGEDTILLIGQRSNLVEADHVLRQNDWQALNRGWSSQGMTMGWEAIDS